MIFITHKQILTISHTNITYLLDHFSKRSYLRIFCWRLGRARRPVLNWFHFFGKVLDPGGETLVSWQLAPVTWRAVCPPWWLVVIHMRVVPGGKTIFQPFGVNESKWMMAMAIGKYCFRMHCIVVAVLIPSVGVVGAGVELVVGGLVVELHDFHLTQLFSGWWGAWSSPGKEFSNMLVLGKTKYINADSYLSFW